MREHKGVDPITQDVILHVSVDDDIHFRAHREYRVLGWRFGSLATYVLLVDDKDRLRWIESAAVRLSKSSSPVHG
jgi:hypothetical protein